MVTTSLPFAVDEWLYHAYLQQHKANGTVGTILWMHTHHQPKALFTSASVGITDNHSREPNQRPALRNYPNKNKLLEFW